MRKNNRIMIVSIIAFLGSVTFLIANKDTSFRANAPFGIANGDTVSAFGTAWTNGSIHAKIVGTAYNIEIGGNNGTPQIPALEIATPQAINGYGAGDYIFVDVQHFGSRANVAWDAAKLATYGFSIQDISNPLISTPQTFYAGSDITTLSEYQELPNPYSNPYWYAPGQYVHIKLWPAPSIKIISLS